jgi:predicted nucleic acid-binding Zn ribbon protein
MSETPAPTDAYVPAVEPDALHDRCLVCNRDFPQSYDSCPSARCRRVNAERSAADLRRRIDRTLDYTDSLLRLPDLASDLTIVLQAVYNSLCTPVASRD